ncbi:MAG: nucleotidyltransferase domain-containing protein [Candidatus Dormibacteria bacterium]
MLNPMFGRSQVRQRILAAFFTTRGLRSHVRDIARRLSTGPSAVGRELARLEGEGILESEVIGRNRVYGLSPSPIATAAREFFLKTTAIRALAPPPMATNRGIPTLAGLHRRKAELDQIAARRGASNLRVFGSVARGTAGEDSDVDLIVDMAPDSRGLDFVGLIVDLEEALGRPVHVVESTSPQEPLLQKVLSESIPL